ncbi:mucin-5AC [Sparus aurata]|uniref:mucin-5AC n=1 Tax=Sparus aurata TaxID=8175 RepID=UPI0011C11CA5|nr:mucin-5AC-like [Sparus aurata]
MDNRLVLTVLLVTLSWLSVGTYAQSTATSAAPGNNMTTASGNMTTAPGNNMTTAPVNMTTAPGNNMTTAPVNMTMAPGNNMTTAQVNMTAAPVNMTTAQVNMTAAPAASPLTANTTVENLETTINRTGCGTEQLCAAEPASCDPAVAGSCFFLSARQTSGQNFEFGLSGEADGYIAATLSSDSNLGGNDTTYICANNNSVVAFFSALLNNGMLTLSELNVNNVRGRVTGNRIQCTFAATVPDTSVTSRSNRASSLALAISTGPFNSTSGALGAPATRLQSPVVNLANPNTTIDNQVLNTTNATASSSNMTTQAGDNTTTASAAPPLTSNTTVESLETTINRTGCGTEQLCAAEPASCNPAVAGSCFFLSARQMSGQKFEFGLSGEADGYIAATLSSDSTLGGNDQTFICANNNSVVAFFSALLNNGMLTLSELNVNNVRGRVTGNRIQCTFAATVPDTSVTSRSNRAASLALAISTGPFNSTSGALGAPTTRLLSPVVNLANPNTTVVNQISTTTNAPTTSSTTTSSPITSTPTAPTPTMTTNHAITFQQSLMQAMLIAAGVLALFML